MQFYCILVMVDDFMYVIKEINIILLIIFIFLNKGLDLNKDYEYQLFWEIRFLKVKLMDFFKLSMVCCYVKKFLDLNFKKKVVIYFV